MRYQSRRSFSSCGDNIAWRSLRPLPCSTRSIMRLESISDTLSETTSETRSPAPSETPRLQKAHDLLGAQDDRQKLTARAVWNLSGRSSVTSKKNRSAVTVLL